MIPARIVLRAAAGGAGGPPPWTGDPVAGRHAGLSARARRAAATAVVGAIGAACVATLLLTGAPGLAALPLVVAASLWAICTVPLRYTVYVVASLAMVADIDPRRFPGNVPGTWVPPTRTLQLLFLENLNKLTGIEALRFAGLEVALVILLVVAVARDQRRAVPRVRMAEPLVVALWLALAATVAMEVRGLARGGDVRQSLWQVRQLLWLAPTVAVFAYAFRRAGEFVGLTRALAVTACVKIAIGLTFYVMVARPQRILLNSVTSHADTVLFVVTLASILGMLAFRPRVHRMVAALPVAAWTTFGIVINHRRTAYVSIGAACVLLYVLLPARRRRAAGAAALCALPFAAVYLAAAGDRREGVWAPASAVHSVFKQRDASSETRDIENYNLLVTLRRHPVLGSGWDPYVESTRAYDIANWFAQYRFVAHNSVLWLWSLGGLVGFTLLWLPLVVGTHLAARSYHLARGPDDRYAAFTVICVIVAYVIQAWADMGTQSWTCMFLLAAALAFSGKLATLTGAWPVGTPVFGRPPRRGRDLGRLPSMPGAVHPGGQGGIA